VVDLVVIEPEDIAGMRVQGGEVAALLAVAKLEREGGGVVARELTHVEQRHQVPAYSTVCGTCKRSCGGAGLVVFEEKKVAVEEVKLREGDGEAFGRAATRDVEEETLEKTVEGLGRQCEVAPRAR
jgi:hypothetical protein